MFEISFIDMNIYTSFFKLVFFFLGHGNSIIPAAPTRRAMMENPVSSRCVQDMHDTKNNTQHTHAHRTTMAKSTSRPCAPSQARPS